MSELLSGLVGALLGAIIGGIISLSASIYTTNKNIKAQNKVFENTLKHEKNKYKEVIDKSIKIISTDLLSAIFEAIRVLKRIGLPGVGVTPIGLTFSSNNCELIERISDNFEYLEVVKLKRIYGILEKIKNDIMIYSNTLGSSEDIERGYLILLSELFNNKYNEVLDLSAEKLNTDELFGRMREDYKLLIKKLSNKFDS